MRSGRTRRWAEHILEGEAAAGARTTSIKWAERIMSVPAPPIVRHAADAGTTRARIDPECAQCRRPNLSQRSPIGEREHEVSRPGSFRPTRG